MTRSIAESPVSEHATDAIDAHNDVVGAIYESVVDPSLWPAALRRVCDAVGGAAAWIAVHYPGQVRSLYEIEVGTDPIQQDQLRTHYVAASPFIGMVHHVRPSDIISVADAVDYHEFLAGRFYREWAGPQGWPDFIMGVLARDAERFTWLGICMAEQVRAEHKERLARLLPHVERAVRISDLLEHKTAQAADLAAMAETLATGMVLIDAGLSVRGVNEAAHRLMRSVAGLSIVEDRLRLPVSENGAAIRAAIAACAEAQIDAAGATVLLESAEAGPGLLVHIMPLTRPRNGGGHASVAAMFLTNASAPTRAPIDAFVARFGLTSSETRVLLGLLDGKTPRAIADAQGVSLATVRTHLRRLYDKTGTNGQTALIRMVEAATRGV